MESTSNGFYLVALLQAMVSTLSSQGTFPYHDIPGFFLVLQFKCNYYPKSRVHIIHRDSKNNTVKQERQSIKGTIQQKKIHLISSGCYVLYYLPFPPIKSSSNFWLIVYHALTRTRQSSLKAGDSFSQFTE